jgi:hypothetical protein
MIITPPQIRVTDDRRQDLLAAAARARLISAATQPAPSAAARPVARVRTGLRQAVATLVALAAIG